MLVAGVGRIQVMWLSCTVEYAEQPVPQHYLAVGVVADRALGAERRHTVEGVVLVFG